MKYLHAVTVCYITSLGGCGERMQDKQMVGVVVGSNDSQEHQDSVEEGWRVVKMIDDFGVYQACLLEVGGLGAGWCRYDIMCVWADHQGRPLAAALRRHLRHLRQGEVQHPDQVTNQNTAHGHVTSSPLIGCLGRRRRVRPDTVLFLTRGKLGEAGELQVVTLSCDWSEHCNTQL